MADLTAAATNDNTPRPVQPICIKLCEPICASSDYRIGIEIFDRPVANIVIRGQTKLFNCNEKG